MSKSVAVVTEALTAIGRTAAVAKKGMNMPTVVLTPARLSPRGLQQPIESFTENYRKSHV
jgi:hypothetical protein